MTLVVTVSGSAAVEPPASCVFDPAIGGSGIVTTEDPNDGYRLDRVAVDRQGRAYSISNLVVNNEYVLDRVRRFNADGSIDESWGDGGHTDLPGQMFSITGRVLAVDDLGRVWVARNSYTNRRQVERLTADGEIDPAIPPLIVPGNGLFDRIGAMEADGTGVVLGHSIVTPPSASVLQIARVADSGAMETEQSFGLQGHEVFVTTVDPSGWIGGQGLPFPGFNDDSVYPVLWTTGSNSDRFLLGGSPGSIVDVREEEGVMTAMGVFFDPGDDEIGTPFSIEMESSVTDRIRYPRRPQRDDFVTGPSGFLPLALFDDDEVVGLSGSPLDAAVVATELDPDGTFEVGEGVPNSAVAAFPAASTVTTGGIPVVVGYADLDTNQMFVAALTPELGPVVSDDALDDQISRLYEAYYLRGPDSGGLAFWREQRASGRSLEEISAQFAGAPEFIDLYGDLSNAAFVDLIYTNVLGRLGDAGGRAFWTTQLELGVRTRGSVMLEFSESSENVVRTGTAAAHDDETGSVYRLYRAYFDRAPDAGGSCFWVRRLVGGAALDEVSDSFASSQEFADTYGSLSNRAFVELVYANVLGRPGEVSGVEFWTGELDNERRTRGQVMVGFSESPEYIERTGTLPGS